MSEEKYNAEFLVRFWSRVDRLMSDDLCWEWKAAKSSGYGTIHLNGHNEGAHRVSYELAYGTIPDGLKVLHSCDNPGCCNPHHLFLGTDKDNSDDKIKKGRNAWVHPEDRWNRKLTWDTVAVIRQRYAAGSVTHRSLSKEYGVSSCTIANVVTNKAWHID